MKHDASLRVVRNLFVIAHRETGDTMFFLEELSDMYGHKIYAVVSFDENNRLETQRLYFDINDACTHLFQLYKPYVDDYALLAWDEFMRPEEDMDGCRYTG